MAVLSPEGYVEIFSLYVRAKYIDTQIKCMLTVTCFIMHYAIGRGPGFTSFYKKNRLLVITSLVKEFTQFPGCIFFENTHEEIKSNYSFSYSPFPRSETLENPA